MHHASLRSLRGGRDQADGPGSVPERSRALRHHHRSRGGYRVRQVGREKMNSRLGQRWADGGCMRGDMRGEMRKVRTRAACRPIRSVRVSDPLIGDFHHPVTDVSPNTQAASSGNGPAKLSKPVWCINP